MHFQDAQMPLKSVPAAKGQEEMLINSTVKEQGK